MEEDTYKSVSVHISGTPRCTLPIAQLEEKLIAYNKKQTFDSKSKHLVKMKSIMN